MGAKHIKISIIITLVMISINNICAAQDTICIEGLSGIIIKNPDGTFYYSSTEQIVNCDITKFSYGRWRQVDDSIFTFVSSINTKHDILKSYGLWDSVGSTNSLIVDVYNENGDLLCTSNGSNIHFYAESSILGITICDSSIQLHGVSPYGQWHLNSKIEDKKHNHYIVVIRDALYYNLEYLYISLVQKRTGNWQLFRAFGNSQEFSRHRNEK